MRKFYNERGITLIALIITIIVMLILVGVTVNVAMNGGLMEKAGTAKEDQETALETEQLQDYILGKMDNNLKIPANLETIKIGDTTYNVTAEEGKEGAIAIKLTKPGEQTPIKTYDLESDIKIKGVTIKPAEETHSFTLNEIDTAIQEAYGKGECESANLAATYVVVEGAVSGFFIQSNIFYDVIGRQDISGRFTYENGIMSITNNPFEIELIAGDSLFLVPNAGEGIVAIGIIRFTGNGADDNDGYVLLTAEQFINEYGDTVFTLES